MYEDLKGKKALVTGAGKKTGIGYAIAGRPAACGCDIVIADLGRPPEAALCRPLFERALRLDPPWRITRIEFRETVMERNRRCKKYKKSG